MKTRTLFINFDLSSTFVRHNIRTHLLISGGGVEVLKELEQLMARGVPGCRETRFTSSLVIRPKITSEKNARHS